MKIFLFILMVQFSFLNVVEMASKNAVTLEMQGQREYKEYVGGQRFNIILETVSLISNRLREHILESVLNQL